MNKIYITILLITLIILGIFLYNKLAFLNVVVKFDELEPFDKQMNVYYKGFKIGKTTKIYPDDEYKNTYIKLKISPHDIKLPSNIVAKIKKRKTKEFVNIIYPEAPTIKYIQDNDIIKGDICKDINSILNDTIEENDVDEIIEETSSLIETANTTLQSLNKIFVQISTMIKNSENDIKITTQNLAKTTKNLENISSKLNNSLNEEELTDSISNIEEATLNIKDITQNIENISTQIDEVTVPIVNSIACDGKEITNGIKKTLNKRLGLSKILFGKPISD